MVRAIGPRCEVVPMALAGHWGMMPKVGLMPAVPVKPQGMRIEPPASEP